MTQTSNSKIIRELVHDINATPGFRCEQVGPHVKVHAPDGRTTMIKVGLGSRKGKDDYDIRRQLRHLVGWPPTSVGRALGEALEATASDPAPSDLALPGLTLVPKTTPPRKPAQKPTTPAVQPPERLPAPAAVNTSQKRAVSPSVSWTQTVYAYLKRIAPSSVLFDEIVRETNPTGCGLASGSASPMMSNRWLDAQPGDVFLHVHRRRVGHGFMYWYDSTERRPERRDDSKRGEEPKPVVPEPTPEPPLVIPVEPDTPVVPEPPEPPSLFERIGATGRTDELLLVDEFGDIWTAQRARLVKVAEQDLIRDDRGGLWLAPESE